jgi:hypothetical protein
MDLGLLYLSLKYRVVEAEQEKGKSLAPAELEAPVGMPLWSRNFRL